jgi:hypothetical protein
MHLCKLCVTPASHVKHVTSVYICAACADQFVFGAPPLIVHRTAMLSRPLYVCLLLILLKVCGHAAGTGFKVSYAIAWRVVKIGDFICGILDGYFGGHGAGAVVWVFVMIVDCIGLFQSRFFRLCKYCFAQHRAYRKQLMVQPA